MSNLFEMPEFFFGSGKVYKNLVYGPDDVWGHPGYKFTVEEVTISLEGLMDEALRIFNSNWLRPIGILGSDLLVSNVAQTSVGNWKGSFDQQCARLIRKLARDHHNSPFYQPQIMFRWIIALYLYDQLARHKIGETHNMLSRRYSTVEPTFHNPLEFRKAPERKMQGSSGVMDEADQIIWHNKFDAADAYLLDLYNEALAAGMAPEQARTKLPVSTMTEVVQTGSLFFYANFCRLRLPHNAQPELTAYAQIIDRWMRVFFPVAWSALMDPPKLTTGQRDKLGEMIYEHYRVETQPLWEDLTDEDRLNHSSIAEAIFLRGYAGEF